MISVEGEGKGRCDADDANVKRGFYNRWNQGESLETAVELCRVASTMGLPGHTFAVLHLDRSLDETSIKGRVSIPEISKYSMWTVDEEGTLTFFESLDHEASRVSMLEKGRAMGMGTGLKIKLDEFDASIGSTPKIPKRHLQSRREVKHPPKHTFPQNRSRLWLQRRLAG